MGSAFTDYTQTLLLAWPIKPFDFFSFGKTWMTCWICTTIGCLS